MSTFAVALRTEILRLARRGVSAELQSLRRSATQTRHQITALKRQIAGLERALVTMKRTVATRKDAPAAAPEAGSSRPMSSKRVRAARQRLGLSQNAFARLLGVSGQSVYNWESGTARPRGAAQAQIVALRALGRRGVQARLAELPETARAASSAKGAKRRTGRRRG